MANRLPTASVQPATRLVQPPCGVRILGPIEVVDAGAEVPLGGRNQRILLARLLVNADEVVSTDRIIDALWGEEPPRTALTSVQNSVARLRKRIGPERPSRSRRATCCVCRTTCSTLAARATSTMPAAEPAVRVEILHEAERLWRGPSLADFLYEAFAQTPIAQLDELRAAIVEERIETELELGRHAELSASSRRGAPAPGAAAAADARALPLGGVRGRLARVPGRTPLAARGAGYRARSCPSEAPRRDPQAGAFLDGAVARVRPADTVEEVSETLLAGRLVPVLGSEVESSPAGSRSGSISPPTRGGDPDRPVRRAHEGVRAALR